MQTNIAWRFIRNFAAGMLMPLMAATGTASAQSHVVSPSELAKAAAVSSASRQQNVETLNRVLGSAEAQQGFAKAGMDSSRVMTAVSQLDDAELAKLAARAEQAQTDFAAGRLSDRDLLWVLVAIAALVLIIVAVR